MNPPTSAIAPFAFSGSFLDANREPGWEVFLLITIICAGFAWPYGWRYARERLGYDVPMPGQTLETTAKVERVGAKIRVAILFIAGLIFIAAGILLTQIVEILVGIASIVWAAVAFGSLKRPGSDAKPDAKARSAMPVNNREQLWKHRARFASVAASAIFLASLGASLIEKRAGGIENPAWATLRILLLVGLFIGLGAWIVAEVASRRAALDDAS